MAYDTDQLEDETCPECGAPIEERYGFACTMRCGWREGY